MTVLWDFIFVTTSINFQISNRSRVDSLCLTPTPEEKGLLYMPSHCGDSCSLVVLTSTNWRQMRLMSTIFRVSIWAKTLLLFFFLTERSRGVSGKQYFPHSIITEGFLAQANQKGVILSYWFSTRYTGLYFREEVVSLWCKGIHVALEPNPCGKHSSFLRGQARDPLKLALYSWWFRNSWLKMNQSSQSVVVC